MISMVIIVLILIIITLFMMMVMGMMNMMEVMMLETPMCENVLQILGMIIPEPGFRMGPDQLFRQDTMESDQPELPN